MYIYIYSGMAYALVICMYARQSPHPRPTPGTFHIGALESTGMSPTLGQILVANSPTPGQILVGISPTVHTND